MLPYVDTTLDFLRRIILGLLHSVARSSHSQPHATRVLRNNSILASVLIPSSEVHTYTLLVLSAQWSGIILVLFVERMMDRGLGSPSL